MISGKPQIALAGLLLAWLAASAPQLAEQYSLTTRMRAALSGRGAAERTAYFDNPGLQATEEIARVVPPENCVTILAYAGPDAAEYYRARFRYLLYPRRVVLATDSAAESENCDYLAVFRDSAQNLRQSPYQGSWDQEGLKQRLALSRRLAASDFVDIFQLP